MRLSEQAKKELLEFAKSGSFKKDIEILRSRWENPFLKNGKVDVDAYIEFVTQFNEFISHMPKVLKPMLDVKMKL
ncbi:MAG: hypothetical protein M1381_09430 [Deltaproteobacteria bacterium]|nr:hypothetical protein [Deltaproteobacteria bacterium]MCL5792746.1 hypothetical protein [Deltaproteobacteria bacterium]